MSTLPDYFPDNSQPYPATAAPGAVVIITSHANILSHQAAARVVWVDSTHLPQLSGVAVVPAQPKEFVTHFGEASLPFRWDSNIQIPQQDVPDVYDIALVPSLTSRENLPPDCIVLDTTTYSNIDVESCDSYIRLVASSSANWTTALDGLIYTIRLLKKHNINLEYLDTTWREQLSFNWKPSKGAAITINASLMLRGVYPVFHDYVRIVNMLYGCPPQNWETITLEELIAFNEQS